MPEDTPEEPSEEVQAETHATPPRIGRPELPMAVQGGPEPAPLMVQPAEDGKFAVQLGAFSVKANAEALAKKVQGYVETSGRYSLVRVGPYATRGQAEQALAMLRERGYRDALIKTLE